MLRWIKFSFYGFCILVFLGACSSKTNSGLALDEVNKRGLLVSKYVKRNS